VIYFSCLEMGKWHELDGDVREKVESSWCHIRCMTTLWTFHLHILHETFTNWIPQVCSTLYQSLWCLCVLMDSALLYWSLWLNLHLLVKYAIFIQRFHWAVFLLLCV
jgi:hypothetical protein